MDFIEKEMNNMFGDDSDSDEGGNTFVCSKKGHEGLSPPVSLVSVEVMDVGGGRGVFAKCDLPAGFLVLSEVPVVTWPEGCSNLEDHSNLLRALHLMCTDGRAFETAAYLHPLALSDADSEEVAVAREILAEDIDNTIVHDSGKTVEDVLRVLLTLQHNGFVSGLYRYLSLVNHSCNPNCIKFSPTASSLNASEIWTTRAVLAGEELAICYCTPVETTRRSMLYFLKTHHRFECTCIQCMSMNLAPNITAPMQAPIATLDIDACAATGGNTTDKAVLDERMADILQNFEENLETMESEIKWGHVADPNLNLTTFLTMIKTINKIKLEFDHDMMAVISNGPVCDVDVFLSEMIPYQQLCVRAFKIGSAASVMCIKAVDVIESKEVGSTVKSIPSVPYGQRVCVKREVSGTASVSTSTSSSGSFSMGHDNDKNQQRQSIIIFCGEAYLTSSLGCLHGQLTYLGADHADLSTSHIELATSIGILLASSSHHSDLYHVAIHTMPFWKHFTVHGNDSLRHAVAELCHCICPVETCSEATGVSITHYSKVTSALGDEIKLKMKAVQKEFDREGKRLKNIYSVHLRYPESIRAHSEYVRNRDMVSDGGVANADGMNERVVSSCYWGSKIVL